MLYSGMNGSIIVEFISNPTHEHDSRPSGKGTISLTRLLFLDQLLKLFKSKRLVRIITGVLFISVSSKIYVSVMKKNHDIFDSVIMCIAYFISMLKVSTIITS